MTTFLLLIALGLLIGLVLGGLGGGGAILTVPALVFLVGQSATAATTSSLVIVGLTAAVGTAAHLRAAPGCCRVGWRLALTLAAAGLPAAWAGSHLNRSVDPDLLLLAFAALMVVAAGAVWRDAGRRPARRPAPPNASPEASAPTSPAHRASGDRILVAEPTDTRTAAEAETAALARVSWPLAIAGGLGVGFLTGFLGVGGGFVILPILVTLFGLPLSVATGTSLAVVALNSGTSLAARVPVAEFDWAVIVPFTIAAMAASVVARRVAARLPTRGISRGFAVLLVLVGAYTGTTSLIHLT